MEIYTIGFTQRTAAEFFETLRRAGIQRLIDVRLNNTSQLAGFAKRDDLAYFLVEICDADYFHYPELSPTKEILEAYKKKLMPWEEYAERFGELLAERKVEDRLEKELFDVPAVLLCSEPKPDHCHRRVVAEYLAEKWDDVQVVHL